MSRQAEIDLMMRKSQDEFHAAMADFDRFKTKAKEKLENLEAVAGYYAKGIYHLEKGNHVYFSHMQMNNFTGNPEQRHSWGEVADISLLGSTVQLTCGTLVGFSKIVKCRLHNLTLVKGKKA